jgi:DUF4097 and DUF4098 domain-containing protein YvlB
MNTRLNAFAATFSLLFISSGFAESTVEETRSMSLDGMVQVENMAGSIEITAWDKAEISITGELGDSVDELEITESSSGVKIEVVNRNNRSSVDESVLYLKVPSTASIEAQGVSADISIDGLDSGSLIAESVSGDIDILARAERLDAESVSGDVTFTGHTMRASVETVSGEIVLKGVEGEFKASTVSGDLRLDGEKISRGRFETVSGDLEIYLDLSEGGRLNVESMSGDFKLVLPSDQQAEFTAQTYSGNIRSDFGSVSDDSYGAGSTLSHREGSSGATIHIETFSGDVRIESR